MSKEDKTIEKRINRNKKILLEQFKKVPIVQLACEKTGISRATYYRWRQEDTDFAKKADAYLAESVDIVNDMAESKLLSLIKEGNMTAIIYWLKHRHKAYSTRVELSGSFEHTNIEISDEHKELIKKALKISNMEETHNEE